MSPAKRQPTALLPQAALSERQRVILADLSAYEGWARPMDIGARDGSHHAATLCALARKGLVERKKYHAIHCYNGCRQRQKLVDNQWVVTDGHPPSKACCCKDSCRYKITPAGRAHVAPVNTPNP